MYFICILSIVSLRLVSILSIVSMYSNSYCKRPCALHVHTGLETSVDHGNMGCHVNCNCACYFPNCKCFTKRCQGIWSSTTSTVHTTVHVPYWIQSWPGLVSTKLEEACKHLISAGHLDLLTVSSAPARSNTVLQKNKAQYH